MVFSIPIKPNNFQILSSLHKQPFLPFPILVSLPISARSPSSIRCPKVVCVAASKSQTGPVRKRSSSPASKKKMKKKTERDADDYSEDLSLSDVEIVQGSGSGTDGSSASDSDSRSLAYHPTPLPKPPAGFVVDDQGRVLMAPTKRIAAIVDAKNNSSLECVIRRIFSSSHGKECMLLCPVDTPVQILKSTNIEGWSAGFLCSGGNKVDDFIIINLLKSEVYDMRMCLVVSDEEVEAILPAVAYSLAKIHMHLVHSGFCYTVRGGFCYSEDDLFDFRSDDDQDVDGLPTEGVEITCFHLDGAHYMIYTPSDPLLFVVIKDDNGLLQIADDDLLEDPAVISAIDEETEFNALVEEEAALLDSLLGKE